MAGEVLQALLDVAIEHDRVAGQFPNDRVPVLLDPAPEGVSRARVGTQGDGAAVGVLAGDVVRELEDQEVVDEGLGLDAAECAEADIFAVDGSCVFVLLLYSLVGRDTAFLDVQFEHSETQAWMNGFSISGFVCFESAFGFLDCSRGNVSQMYIIFPFSLPLMPCKSSRTN